MTQKNLSPRQARWLETLSDFDFTVQHIPGETNELADSLSRIYSAEALGVVRAASEFVNLEDTAAAVGEDMLSASMNLITRPLHVMAILPEESAVVDSAQGSGTKNSRKTSARVVLRVRDPSTGDLLPRMEGATPADAGDTPLDAGNTSRGDPGTNGKKLFARDDRSTDLDHDMEIPAQTPEEELENATGPRLTALIAQAHHVDIPACLKGKY